MKTRKEDPVMCVNDLIQRRLRKEKLTRIDPVTATKWLIEAGLRQKLESRPGSYLRSLCRNKKIPGAKKSCSRWVIKVQK